MAYDLKFADRIRAYLADVPRLDIDEKGMFRGVTFMVNGKVSVCVSRHEMMLRFGPGLQDTFSEQQGFRCMICGGSAYKGYGYISPENIRGEKNFAFWIQQCLDFNPRAKASAKRKK